MIFLVLDRIYIIHGKRKVFVCMWLGILPVCGPMFKTRPPAQPDIMTFLGLNMKFLLYWGAVLTPRPHRSITGEGGDR